MKGNRSMKERMFWAIRAMKHIVFSMLVISVILSSVGLSACKTTEGLKVKEIWGIDWTLWATMFVQLEATPNAKEGQYSVELRADTEKFGSQVVTYTKGQTIPKLEWTIGIDSRAFARVSLKGGKERAREVFQCDISFLEESTTVVKPHQPVITSVSTIRPTQTQTITIRGQGFGQQNPYNGNSEYISVSDLTQNWSAGYLGSAVTLNVTSWSDTQIVISGFTGQYGKQGWALYSGDSIQITLWVTPDLTRPITYKTTIP